MDCISGLLIQKTFMGVCDLRLLAGSTRLRREDQTMYECFLR